MQHFGQKYTGYYEEQYLSLASVWGTVSSLTLFVL